MRCLDRVILAGLLLALPSASMGGAGGPIPQDPDRQKQRFDDMLAWNQRTLEGAYEKVGNKDPKWDKAAREALEEAARFFSHAIDPPPKQEVIFNAAKRALEAGCDDPLILYLYARSSYIPNYPGEEELARRYAKAAKALENSAYPPFRKATALCKAGVHQSAQKNLSPEARKEAARFLDSAIAMLAQSVKEDERNLDMDNNWFATSKDAIKAHRQLTGSYQAAFDRVDGELAKAPELKVIRLQVKADSLIAYGWEARGSGFADTVTEEGGRLFRERLAQAGTALEKAWDLEPGSSRTATLMLSVELGIGGGNRHEMEKWFERAMKAEGNNHKACAIKLHWLLPKWYGSVEDVLAFGQACRDTKNWRARITLLTAEAHLYRARQLPDEERRNYLASPRVWNEIQSVYEEYLAHYPYDYIERSFYAAYCYSSGRFLESDKQFRIVGDKLAWSTAFPEAWMKQARAYVADKAKSVERPPAAKPPPAQRAAVKPPPMKPPHSAPIKPPPMKMQAPAVAPVQPIAQPELAGSAWWILLILGLGGIMIVGGVSLYFLIRGSGADRDDDREEYDEDRSRKKKKRRR